LLSEENRGEQRKASGSDILFAINPTRIGLASNSGLRFEKQETNCVSHGKAHSALVPHRSFEKQTCIIILVGICE